MKNYSQDELQSILDLHRKWLYNEEGGERANLCDANLCDANLRGANLFGANLCDANLRGANLCDANLCDANLCDANLRGANLRGANLCDANLCDANLWGANLRGANLCDANLCDANLCDANLRVANLCGANLCDANLCDANLRGANLRGANLRGANLRGAKNVSEVTAARTLIVPEEGAFIGWKKAKSESGLCIVKLEITADAQRSNATGRKCRCSKARVLEIETMSGKSVESAWSDWRSDFIYKVGETVEVDDFDPNRWEECSAGIHFFITRAEAEDYTL